MAENDNLPEAFKGVTNKQRQTEKFELPEVSDKNMAVVVLGIMALGAMYFLKDTSVPIITGIAGSIGGFVTGQRWKR